MRNDTYLVTRFCHSSNHTFTPSARNRSASGRTSALSFALWLRKNVELEVVGHGVEVVHVASGYRSSPGIGGDSGEDGVHFFPIHTGGALGDGGAVRGVIELRGEGAGDEGVHRDVFALGEFAGLRGEAVWQLDDDVHDAGSMTANSRGARRRCRCGGRV